MLGGLHAFAKWTTANLTGNKILGLPEIPKCFIVTTIITATDLLFSPKMCKWEGKIEIVDKSIEDPGL